MCGAKFVTYSIKSLSWAWDFDESWSPMLVPKKVCACVWGGGGGGGGGKFHLK